MSFSAEIVADSISESGYRLTTFVFRYPRFIHSELMTHRMLSRNASSSRAIPVKKQLERIRTDPAQPVEWGKNKAGMQSTELLTDDMVEAAKKLWEQATAGAVSFSEELAALNVHKQIVNRIAEPFSHITVVVTATEWANFFTLRDHPDAQPEFQVLAKLAAEAYRAGKPVLRGQHDWHLPFVREGERAVYPINILIKLSVARCARVSYLNHDGSSPDYDKDIGLHDDLVVKKPLHASPAEHQGTPFFRPTDIAAAVSAFTYPYDLKWSHKLGRLDTDTPWSANFRGWFQYRQGLSGQNAETFPWEPGVEHEFKAIGYAEDVQRLKLVLKTFAAHHTTEATPLGHLALEVYEKLPHIEPLFKADDHA